MNFLQNAIKRIEAIFNQNLSAMQVEMIVEQLELMPNAQVEEIIRGLQENTRLSRNVIAEVNSAILFVKNRHASKEQESLKATESFHGADKTFSGAFGRWVGTLMHYYQLGLAKTVNGVCPVNRYLDSSMASALRRDVSESGYAAGYFDKAAEWMQGLIDARKPWDQVELELRK